MMRILLILALILSTFSCQKNESFDLSSEEANPTQEIIPMGSAQLRDLEPEVKSKTCDCTLTYLGATSTTTPVVTIFAENGAPLNDPNYDPQYNFSVFDPVPGTTFDITLIHSLPWQIGVQEDGVTQLVGYDFILNCPDYNAPKSFQVIPNLHFPTPLTDLGISIQKSFCVRCGCYIKVESISNSTVELDIRSNDDEGITPVAFINPSDPLPVVEGFNWASGIDHGLEFIAVNPGGPPYTPETEVRYRLKCTDAKLINLGKFFLGTQVHEVLINEGGAEINGVHIYHSDPDDCSAYRTELYEPPLDD